MTRTPCRALYLTKRKVQTRWIKCRLSTPTAYEAWVSLPDDMEVKPPLVKKTFGGGMYAAHVLRDWNFQDWTLIQEWVSESERYEEAGGPCFEEILNYYNLMNNGAKMEDTQIDLLLPIKETTK